MTTLFEKLGPPPAEAAPPKEQIKQPVDNLEKILDWLINRWTKDTVTLRDIFAYGPYPARNKEAALSLMQILSTRGWVIPTKSNQYRSKRWKISRKQTIQP